MKIVTNEGLINRNKKIGQVATFSSLAVLAVGFFMAWKPETMNYSFTALIVGFILSQVGIYFGTRFVRSPTPVEVLNQKLKGLGEKFVLYHYKTKVPHLLIGPAGIWVLSTYFQPGIISYDSETNRYKQGGRSLYMRLFSQETLGRPDLETKAHIEETSKYLQKLVEGVQLPPVKAAVVFVSDKAKVQVENAPYPTMHVDKLKEFIRRQVKPDAISEEALQALKQALPQE
ncbi:MAG: hypothetical protein HPY45_06790 [Anaerolineae bacterium]|nr:hypothetical protein [Anaerolineae bacterium]